MLEGLFVKKLEHILEGIMEREIPVANPTSSEQRRNDGIILIYSVATLYLYQVEVSSSPAMCKEHHWP